MNNKSAIPQPQPKPGKVNVADYVLQDIQARVDFGLEKYGTKLQTFNGRDALQDAYQEAIDLVMYLRQRILEEEFAEAQDCPHKNTVLNTSGGMHFSDGEVWDDIETEVLCLDCGEVIDDDKDESEEIPY